MRQFISRTVFNPLDAEAPPDKVLAVFFHRSAAMLYLIYSLWGFASIFGSIPTIAEAQGDLIQIFFSMLVTPIAFTAFVGATYFPKFARLEMYMAASLVTLLFVYEVIIAIAFFQGDIARGVGFILNTTHFVIATARVAFIYRTLIRQAGDKINA